MQRRIPLVEGEYYHVYNRGVEKRKIFLDIKDYERFIKLLFFCNSVKSVEIRNLKDKTFKESLYIKGDPLVSVGAYCLMPNHFHLLLREKTEGGISMYMKKVSTAYSMYFNTKNERTGTLFEGRFKSSHANKDEYLKYLFSYIHLNPAKLIDRDWKEKGSNVKTEVENFVKNYSFSSFKDYNGDIRDQSHILQMTDFPEYFNNPKSFEDYIKDWVHFENL